MSRTELPRHAPPTATARAASNTEAAHDIRAMTEALRAFNAARQWEQFHSPRNLAMALSVEAAELLELFLWSEDEGPQPALAERAARLPEEAADVLICLLNLCDRTHIDLASAFRRKLALNRRRYPVRRSRGSMRKYDETSETRPTEAGSRRPKTGRKQAHKTEPPRSRKR